MNDLEFLINQIVAQIENKYTFDISFSDAKGEIVRLYELGGARYIQPLFCDAKHISKLDFDAICSMSENFKKDGAIREFDAETELSYDEFFAKYYNPGY